MRNVREPGHSPPRPLAPSPRRPVAPSPPRPLARAQLGSSGTRPRVVALLRRRRLELAEEGAAAAADEDGVDAEQPQPRVRVPAQLRQRPPLGPAPPRGASQACAAASRSARCRSAVVRIFRYFEGFFPDARRILRVTNAATRNYMIRI